MARSCSTCLVLLTLVAAACRAPTGAGRSENLPHVPVFPGAQLRETATGPQRDPTESYVVQGATQADVLDWYRRQMPAWGWTPSTDADDAFVIYHTVEGCYGFVAAYENPDGSVDLQLSEQSPDTPCEPYVTSPAGHD